MKHGIRVGSGIPKSEFNGVFATTRAKKSASQWRGSRWAKLWILASGTLLAGAVLPVSAGVNVDGSLDETDYGTPAPGTAALSTQTINSSFGSNQLDAEYAVVENGDLNLFFAGNMSSGNVLNLFFDDGRTGGQNVLAANTSAGSMSKMNGAIFSPGFNATFALECNISGNFFYVDQYNLISHTATYIGSVPLTGNIGNNQNVGGLAVGVNNNIVGGITTDANGGAANQSSAQTVSTGFEFAIPLSVFGNPVGGAIKVLADINGSADSGCSNQFLPGLPAGTISVKKPTNAFFLQGTGTATNGEAFTFASLSNEYVSVPVPVADGIWLPAGGGSWTLSTNWSNGHIPDSVGATASFSNAAAASTITLDGVQTVTSVSFNDVNAYTIAANASNTGTGSLVLDNGTGSAAINDYGGQHFITAPVVLNSTTVVTCQNHGDQFTISGNINGSGGLTVSNSGIYQTTFSALILSGSNSYQGPTTISRGELQLQSATALPAGTSLSMSAASPHAVLDLNNFNASVSNLVVTGTGTPTANITNNSTSPGLSTLTFAGNVSNPSTFSGTISDNFNNGGGTTALTVASGSLTLTGSSTYSGATTVTGGTLTLAGVATVVSGQTPANPLPANASLNISSGGSVVLSPIIVNGNPLPTEYAVTIGTVNALGKLDINNNALIIHNTSIGAVTAFAAAGYHNGSWNGSGIMSTLAAADTAHLTAVGVILNNTDGFTALYGEGTAFGDFDGTSPLATDVLAKYTYFGDANLDGMVDGSDYSLIDNGFLQHLTGWFNGDFNYDGVVNGSDYTLIDNTFNQQGASLASALATSQVASAVPEPASLSLIGIGTVALLGRTRSRRLTAGR